MDTKAWQKLKSDAQRARMLASADALQVVGSDISTDMLAITRANWERAGLPGEARTKQVDARFVQPPFEEPGLLLMNPPYGERIAVRGQRRLPEEEMPRDEVEEAAANQFASAFATTLKQHFAGWQAWVFTGDMGSRVAAVSRSRAARRSTTAISNAGCSASTWCAAPPGGAGGLTAPAAPGRGVRGACAPSVRPDCG